MLKTLFQELRKPCWVTMGLAASTAFVPWAAAAQDVSPFSTSGLYVSGAIGPNFAGSIVSQSSNNNIQTSAGPVGVLALGYRLPYGFRAEIEGDFRSNNVTGILTRRVDGQILPMTRTGGSPSSYGAMANGLFDIPLARLLLPFKLSIGGGIGYSRVDFGSVSGAEPFLFPVQGGGTFAAPSVRSNGAAGAFAYQAIAGISMPLAFVRGLELTAEYRYFGTTYATVPVVVHASAPVPANVTSTTFNSSKNSLGDSSVLFGFRYGFDSPVPVVQARY